MRFTVFALLACGVLCAAGSGSNDPPGGGIRQRSSELGQRRSRRLHSGAAAHLHRGEPPAGDEVDNQVDAIMRALGPDYDSYQQRFELRMKANKREDENPWYAKLLSKDVLTYIIPAGGIGILATVAIVLVCRCGRKSNHDVIAFEKILRCCGGHCFSFGDQWRKTKTSSWMEQEVAVEAAIETATKDKKSGGFKKRLTKLIRRKKDPQLGDPDASSSSTDVGSRPGSSARTSTSPQTASPQSGSTSTATSVSSAIGADLTTSTLATSPIATIQHPIVSTHSAIMVADQASLMASFAAAAQQQQALAESMMSMVSPLNALLNKSAAADPSASSSSTDVGSRPASSARTSTSPQTAFTSTAASVSSAIGGDFTASMLASSPIASMLGGGPMAAAAYWNLYLQQMQQRMANAETVAKQGSGTGAFPWPMTTPSTTNAATAFLFPTATAGADNSGLTNPFLPANPMLRHLTDGGAE